MLFCTWRLRAESQGTDRDEDKRTPGSQFRISLEDGQSCLAPELSCGRYAEREDGGRAPWLLDGRLPLVPPSPCPSVALAP